MASGLAQTSVCRPHSLVPLDASIRGTLSPFVGEEVRGLDAGLGLVVCKRQRSLEFRRQNRIELVPHPAIGLVREVVNFRLRITDKPNGLLRLIS